MSRYDFFTAFTPETYEHKNKSLDEPVRFRSYSDLTEDKHRISEEFKSVIRKYESTRLTGTLYTVQLTDGYHIPRVDDDSVAAEGVVGSTDVYDGLEASIAAELTGPWDMEGFEISRLDREEGAVAHNWRYELSKPCFESSVDFSLYKPRTEPGELTPKFPPEHSYWEKQH